MELIYINAAGGRLTLKQTRPFFLSKLDGTGSARQSINTFKAPDQDGVFYISSTLDMRNITLEGTVIMQYERDFASLMSAANVFIRHEVPSSLSHYYELSQVLHFEERGAFFLMVCRMRT